VRSGKTKTFLLARGQEYRVQVKERKVQLPSTTIPRVSAAETTERNKLLASDQEQQESKPICHHARVKSQDLHRVISLIVSIALWGLAYAFIEKKECSKEEKTLGQSWEIARRQRENER
jgi:hypothetical protein